MGIKFLHDFEYSESELKAIFDYINEEETLKHLTKELKIYTECCYEEVSEQNEIHDGLDVYEEVCDKLYEDIIKENLENMQGDYDLMQYYCEPEAETGDVDFKVYYNGYSFIPQIEYEAQLDRCPSDYELEQLDCLSEEELQQFVELQTEAENYWNNMGERDEPWDYFKDVLDKILEQEEPWEYYPEVLEALCREDYGDDITVIYNKYSS